MTQNKFILSIIEFGYIIQFVTLPPFLTLKSNPFSPSRTISIAKEVSTLLSKEAVGFVPPCDKQFMSPIFDVPKKDCEDRRVILNLKVLNSYIRKSSFKLEGYDQIISMINRHDYFVSIDLQDAFIMISMHETCFKYLCFDWDKYRLQYRCMPFGMTSSPRIFTKVFKSVLTFLRSRGLKISAWFDDIILVANSISLIREHMHFTLLVLKSLGFIPHPVKSMLIPSQTINHLGFVWDSNKFTLAVPVSKIMDLKLLCNKAISERVSLRFLSRILGTIENFRIAFPHAPLHYRSVQREVASYISVHSQWDQKVTLSSSAISDLNWWANCPVPLPERPLDPFVPEFTVTSDSSESGWGAVTSFGSEASGFWSQSESLSHINILETKTVLFAFKALFRNYSNVHILIRSDNTTTVAYVNNMGGVRSQAICDIILDLYEFCIARDIRIKASHLAGRFNSYADALSRKSRDHCYSLPPDLFSEISAQISFVPQVDLFASRLNYLVSNYYSEGPDPFASNFDAFSCTWPDKVYAFPPIHMVHKFIARFLKLNIKYGLLICPFWPSMSYFPTLLNMLFDTPFIISASRLANAHHLPRTASLFLVSSITSDSALSKAYQKKQQPVCYAVSLLQPSSNILEAGNYLPIGVIRQKLIMALSM